MKIPANPDAVLRKYYGADWKTPPFCTKKELVEKYADAWYSKAPTNISTLKHIANILSFKR